MVSYVGAELRRLVALRAKRLCEYCLIDEDDTFLGCEVDHIISSKHGGLTEADNLAFACVTCNRSKGSDVGSIVSHTGDFSRFFDPRTDRWSDCFALEDVTIEPLTDIGEVTTRILAFNSSDRLLERAALRDVGRYPSASALRRIEGS
jgi:hypothetical protein